MAKIPNPRDIILAPVVSEKSYGLMEENTYVFFVAKTANKNEIKIATEDSDYVIKNKSTILKKYNDIFTDIQSKQ